MSEGGSLRSLSKLAVDGDRLLRVSIIQFLWQGWGHPHPKITVLVTANGNRSKEPSWSLDGVEI